MTTYHYHYTGQDLAAVSVDKDALCVYNKGWLPSYVDYNNPFGLMGSWVEYDGRLMYELVQQDTPDRDPIIIQCPARCTNRL